MSGQSRQVCNLFEKVAISDSTDCTDSGNPQAGGSLGDGAQIDRNLNLMSLPNKVLAVIHDQLTNERKKALSLSNKRLFALFRPAWLSRYRHTVAPKLRSPADVAGFSALMSNPDLGKFGYLRLDIYCELGPEMDLPIDDNVSILHCYIGGSVANALTKLSQAFPNVKTLRLGHVKDEPILTHEAAAIPLSWNLTELHVSNIPLGLLVSATSQLEGLSVDYRSGSAEGKSLRIPPVLLASCRSTLKSLSVFSSTSAVVAATFNDIHAMTALRGNVNVYGRAQIEGYRTL